MSAQFDYSRVIRLLKVNSVDFVRRAFACYENRQVFAIDGAGAASNADLLPDDVETIVPDDGGGWFDLQLTPVNENDPAQIIFSSGTTGRPKAIVISHAALADVVTRLNTRMGVDASIREYIGAPVTFSFGLGRARAIASAGGRGYIPENGFNLKEIHSMLQAGEINAISAVPSLWAIVLDNAELLADVAHQVKWIEIGSQYMSAQDKIKLREIFSKATIYQHYGLTEASRSTLLDISNSPAEVLEAVGRVAEDGVEVRLDNEQRIQIKGKHIALGRLNDSGLESLQDADGWLTTSDLGEITDGYLYYRGRHDDLINCAGIKIDPETLQQRVNQELTGIATVAITGVPDAQRGEGFFVAVQDEHVDHERIRDAVNQVLQSLTVNARDAIYVQFVADIPKTETGKIRRKALATMFTPRQSTSSGVKQTGSPLLQLYQEVFFDEDVTPASSFVDLGGDSLNFVKLSISIERSLGFLPEGWESVSIADLESMESPGDSMWSPVESSVLLRASAIVCIVLSHAGFLAVGGGTYLLFLLIGTNFARFQFREFTEGHIWNVLPWYAAKIVIPYMVLAVVYSVMIDYFDPRVFLLIHNFWSVNWTILFPFWFVQVLVQCLLLFCLLFSVPQIRSWLRDRQWFASFAILLALIVLRFTYPFIWDTTPMSDLVAPRFVVYLWLGWTLYLASSVPRKLLTSAIGIAFAFLDNTNTNFVFWLTLGCLVVPFVATIPVPRPVKWAANYLAAATFYMFMFNGSIISVSQDVFGIDSIVINTLLAISISLVLWHLLEHRNILSHVVTFGRNILFNLSGRWKNQ